MNKADETRKLESWGNSLLCRERAAVEVYGLATKLLDGDLETPDYEALQQLHQKRSERLSQFIESIGCKPRVAEVGWDRPRSAVLCAATLYDSEPPQEQLLEFEKEIEGAYLKCAVVCHAYAPLKQLLSSELFSAGSTIGKYETVRFSDNSLAPEDEGDNSAFATSTVA